MSEKYKMHDPEGIYFTTTTVVNWIDLFTRKELKHVVVDSLKYCQKEKGLIIYAWCLMPSHLHMIVSSREQSISGIMRDFKKFTSKAFIKEFDHYSESRQDWLLNMFSRAGRDLKRVKNFKVWQDGNHSMQLMTPWFSEQKLNYIHMNPVKDEIVVEPHYYWYSSARNYNDERGLIDVEFL